MNTNRHELEENRILFKDEVYEKIIVELKAINKISSIEESQILNYLKATNLKLGLIINFGNSKLEWKRYIF